MIGRSFAPGRSSVLNWLASRPGHKCPLRAASRAAIRSCVPRERRRGHRRGRARARAIGALQRRAGDDGALTGGREAVDLVGNCLQPRPAVFVRQRMAGAHLRDVACRVKPVAILVAPAESSGEIIGDGALARAGTPITTSAQGVLLPTKILRKRGPVYRPDRLAGGSRAVGWQVLGCEEARQDRTLAVA